jgi:hypothetical protein
MSSRPDNPLQTGVSSTLMEERMLQIAATFPYPATPDIIARERKRLAGLEKVEAQPRPRRLAFGLALLLVVLMAALLISPARARVLNWIRIGSVRIFLTAPTPTATPSESSTISAPKATPTFLKSVLDLAGETSLSDAQGQLDFTILQPAYPSDLGLPDRVFLQRYDLRAVILVWTDQEHPEKVRLSLTEAPSQSYIFEKYAREAVLDTQVNGQAAVWIDGGYPLVTRDGDLTFTRLVNQSHTLIWNDGELTYRLETDEDLEMAIRIAESIQ